MTIETSFSKLLQRGEINVPGEAKHHERPQGMDMQVSLSIHTNKAYKIIFGRRADNSKARVITLRMFVSMIATMWRASSQGDPFANWRMDETYKIITEANETLEAYLEGAEELLKHVNISKSFNVRLASSRTPLVIDLSPWNAYAFNAAKLCGTYDGLMRYCITLNRMGKMSVKQRQEVQREGFQIVQNAFNYPKIYRYSGVTCDDAVANNEIYKTALESMNNEELPKVYLQGKRAGISPPIRTKFEVSAIDADAAVQSLGTLEKQRLFLEDGSLAIPSNEGVDNDDEHAHDESEAKLVIE
ncbi:MAG: TIGR03761 family integrating conjugative element protein [Mariprofundales bacterium]